MANQSSSSMNVALRFQADVNQARAELKALRADAEAVSQGAKKIDATPIDRLAGSAKQAGSAAQGLATSTKSASAETRTLADASRTATAAAQAQARAVNSAAKANQAAGISAKQHAAAMRMLPAQMTDITVGLSTGQSPFTVLMQQGGQLKDMFGGVGPAAKAVGGSVAGLVNPLTVTAAAVAVLIAGYAKGSKESDAFNQSIVMTGNAVGTTSSQLAGMATRIDGVIGTTYEAAEALSALASTGQVSSKNIEQLATTAVRMERVLGQAVSTTVEQFNELGRSPVEASRKLNESYGYLTSSVYAQIKALVEQRKEDEAAELAQKTFSAAMDERTAKLAANAGTLEKAWRGVRDTVRETWDAILAVGRPQTDEALVASAEKQVDFLRQRLAQRQARGRATGDITAKLAAAEANLESLHADRAAKEQKAVDDAASRQRTAATNKALDDYDARAKRLRTKKQQLDDEIEGIKRDGKLLIDAGLKTQADIDKQIAAAKAQAASKATGIKKDPVDTAYQSQLQQVQTARAQAAQNLANAEANVASNQEQATVKLDAWLAVNKNALKLDDARIAKLRAETAETDRLNKATKDLQDSKARTERIVRGMAEVDRAISLAQGRTADAMAAQQEEQWRSLRGDLTKNGAIAGLAKIDQLMGLERAKVQLESLQQQADRIFSDQSRSEQSLANQVTAGLMGELEAKRQILSVNGSTAAQIEALLPKMRELAEITGNPAAIDRVKDLEVRIQGLRTKANEVQQAFGEAFGSSLSNSLKSLADGTATLGEAVRSLLSNLAAGMGEWAAQQLAMQAKEGLLGMFASSNSAITAAATPIATTAASGIGAVVDTAGTTAEAAATAAATTATIADTAATVAATAATTALSTAAMAAAAAMQAMAASSASSGASNALGALSAGFSSGGWTGPGTKFQPAGIVHADEFVHRQEVVRQPGALAFLTRFNQVGMAALKGWQGYADGGLVVGDGASLGLPKVGAFKPAVSVNTGGTTVDAKLALNLIDDPDRIAGIMGSKAGEKALTVLLSRNPMKFRQILGN